jgi:cytoskeletal protein RodZ
MRKFVIVLGAFGLLAFTGLQSAAEEKSSATEKTEVSTSSTGQQKKTTVKKVEHADGSTSETTTTTTTNKKGSKAAAHAHPARVEDSHKTKREVTLDGKQRTKETSKVENADGTGKATTTVTETK